MQRILFILCLWVGCGQSLPAKSWEWARDTTRKGEQQAQARELDALTDETSPSRSDWRDKVKKKINKSRFGKRHLKKPQGNFIELDPLMITIAFVLGIGLLLLLWFLFRKISMLSFGWAFLLAIGFAAALFFWFLARSEGVDTVAWYEYFIKFGIFAFIGLALVLGGFIAIFGGAPNMAAFFLWGLILGGVSLILSIIFNNSVLNEIFPYWFR